MLLLAICAQIIREGTRSPKVAALHIEAPHVEALTELEMRLEARIAEIPPRRYIENWAYCPPHYYFKETRDEALQVILRECRECPIIEGWPIRE